MRTYADLSDELRALAPAIRPPDVFNYTHQLRTDFVSRLEDRVTEAMQEAFKLGKGCGFREGDQAATERARAQHELSQRLRAADKITIANLEHACRAGETHAAELEAQLQAQATLIARLEDELRAPSIGMALLDSLVRAVVNEYQNDPSMPSVIVSLVHRGPKAGQWYASVCRYHGSYGKEKEVVRNCYEPSAFLALQRLAKVWLNEPEPIDPNPKEQLRAVLHGKPVSR